MNNVNKPNLILFLTIIKDRGNETLSLLDTIIKKVRIDTLLFAKEMKLVTKGTKDLYHMTELGLSFLGKYLQQELISEENVFSVRVRNTLKILNITTWGELSNMTSEELLAIRNFGKTSLMEVTHYLKERRLSLKQ